MDKKGSGFTVYQSGKIVGKGKATPAELKAGDVTFGNRQWKKGQATTKELEANTPLRYHHDALASAIGSNVELTKVYNNVRFLEDFLKSPIKDKIMTKGASPPDWREVSDIPQLRGYKFEPRIANVLQDFNGSRGTELGENIGKVSRILTGSLFWNPLPHIFNVLDHAIVQRGLVSGWANPMAYPRLMRTTIAAARAVTQQTPEYARFIKEGAGLMYPNVLVNDFSAKVLKQLGSDPKMNPVAKAWGYVSPAEMVKRIYSFSRHALWMGNDIIMMQAYLEREMTNPGSVIRDVERHIPNYRIPDKVLGSRMISEFLRSPVALAFGRYDYGRMASYGAMMKDLVGKDATLADRAKALDQMAMIGFMGLVVYPLLMDNAAKAITGNNNATVQRFGASTIPFLVYEYLHGDKEYNQVLSSSFPEGMAIKSALELKNDRDLFTGKHLIEEPADVATFIGHQLSPLYTAGRIAEGKQTAGQFALQSVGIKSPTSEQLEKNKAFKQREKAHHEKEMRKRRGEE